MLKEIRFTHRKMVEGLDAGTSSPSDETLKRRPFYSEMGSNLQSSMRRLSWIADL